MVQMKKCKSGIPSRVDGRGGGWSKTLKKQKFKNKT
jgi:hypothetical protein